MNLRHTEKMDKRTLFNWSLKVRGRTPEEFAHSQGVTERMLHYVLCGERKSAALEAAVDAFIRDTLPSIRATLDEAETSYQLAA